MSHSRISLMASSVRLADGSFDFSGGIDSGRVTTIQSAANPNGLMRTQLAWLTNGTVRGGGISPRYGWTKRGTVHAGTALYQSGLLYQPNFANPNLVLSIGGRIFQVDVDTDFNVTDLSAQFGLANPPAVTKGFMAQGEQFLVIQAGDYQNNLAPTLPLFWDGTALRRSNGITAGGPFGPTPITYTVAITANFIVPAAGNTVVVTTAAPYPGSVNDVGDWTFTSSGIILGTFQVTNIAGLNLTLKTVSSPFVGATIAADTFNVATTIVYPGNPNELPAAGPMVYYQGRVFYAQGRQYTAGDIVDGPSGTLAYNFDDSILKVTENPLAVGGDGFKVPSTAGDITGLAYTSNQDSTLGQGPLYAGTRKQIFALQVPVTRADWIAANTNNRPIQTIAQLNWGWVNDRSIVHSNGDLFYQSLEPAVRSLFVNLRYFKQWGNKQISRNEERILAFNNRALMPFATGVLFDNRLLMGVNLVQTPVGVASQGLMPLDFDIISGFGQEGEDLPPAWEGLLEGLDHLQLFAGDFGGRERCFSVVHSRVDDSIEIWELTDFLKADQNGPDENRVTYRPEFPAYEFGKIFDLKELDGGELWVDRISGTIELTVEYRVDADPCWQPWFHTEFCAAQSSCEDVDHPVCYPLVGYCEGYKFPITLPKPIPQKCATFNHRLLTRAYQFQPRVTVKGFCRVRGIILFALPIERAPFEGLKC